MFISRNRFCLFWHKNFIPPHKVLQQLSPLHFCLWHLHTLKSNEAYYQLFVALKIALCDLGISHYPKAMFYDKKHYAQMRYILLVPLWLHKLNSFRVCDIKGIFRLRLSRNGSVIRIFGKTLYSNGKHYL